MRRAAAAAPAFASGRAYGGLVYGRTATLLETLARVYGEDKLTAALGAYTSRHRMRNPVPEDLLAAIGEHLGDEARALTRAALFDQATIDYAVVEVGSQRRAKPAGLFDRNGKRETESGASEDDFEGYALVEARGTLQLPLDVAFVTEDGAEVRTRVGGAIHANDTTGLTTKVSADDPRIDKRTLSVAAQNVNGKIHVPVVEFMQLFGKTASVE